MAFPNQRIGGAPNLGMVKRSAMRLEARCGKANMNEIAFDNEPPQGETVTSYDERHFITYIRLLDAEEDGADWREAVAIIFGIDPAAEPVRAKAVYDNHMARARWMTKSGYKHLLRRD